MEITPEYNYKNATEEYTKYTVAYHVSTLDTFFRWLYTNFDDYIQLRCLYNILHDMEEHCMLLANFRYIFVYIF